PVDDDPFIGGVLLYATGEKATPFKLPETLWNFQQHGYKIGEGPFKLGRDSVSPVIKKPVKALEGPVHGQNVAADFDREVKYLLPTMSAFQQLSFPPKTIGIYSTKNPRLSRSEDSRNDWSILGFAGYSQPGARIIPKRFNNPPKNYYAYAQAEIYNDSFYDLYTQKWKAKLVPARLLRDNGQSGFRRVLQKYPELQNLMSRLTSSQLDSINAH
ncbi:MAG: hypothetical protein ACI909_003301, partial [Planctomycetota bacterium]